MYEIIENDIDIILSKVSLLPLKNKSILITGASGLLGMYFISCLKRLQTEYNLDVYLWIKSDIEKKFEYFFDFKCNIIQHDITDVSFFDSLVKFDYIIHSSGYGQPTKFVNNKIKTIQINTTSTIELLKLLKYDGKFLFISSSEVYNGLDKFEVTENEIGNINTDDPRSCYIESKKCGETICHSFDNKNIKIARLSTCYGPGAKNDDSRVLGSLIKKSIMNDIIELLDGGQSIRTLCYITDVIEMMWNILLYGKEITYNVGGIYKLNILELAEKIGLYFNKTVKVPELSNELSGSPKIVNISIDKYKNEFNKNDFIDIDTGLKNTIRWHLKIIEK